MTDTRRRKKVRSEFRRFRKREGIYRCRDCGKKLITECHHFYCNKCWKERKKIKWKNKFLDEPIPVEETRQRLWSLQKN